MFGISATTAAVIAAGAVVATTAYTADQNRKGIHAQQDALKLSQAQDARETAEAGTSAQVAANAKLADAKRRRMASTLATGAGDQTLAGGSTVLGAGNSSQVSRSTVAANAPTMRNASVLAGGSI